MRFDRIEIASFGRLHDHQVAFASGLNVVVGPNEAGKSTLLWAIQTLLYGPFTDSNRWASAEAREKYRPWNGGPHGGAILLTLASGESYRLERDLREEKTAIYREPGASDVTREYASGRHGWVDFADRHLGLSPAVFRASAGIHQEALLLDGNDVRALQTRLEALADTGGTEQSAQDALKRLAGWRTEINPDAVLVERSPLRQAEEAARGLRARGEAARAALDSLADLLAAEKRLAERVAALRAELVSRTPGDPAEVEHGPASQVSIGSGERDLDAARSAVQTWERAEADLLEARKKRTEIRRALAAHFVSGDPSQEGRDLEAARQAITAYDLRAGEYARARAEAARRPVNPDLRAELDNLDDRLGTLSVEKLAELRALDRKVERSAQSPPFPPILIVAVLLGVVGVALGYALAGWLGALAGGVGMALLGYLVAPSLSPLESSAREIKAHRALLAEALVGTGARDLDDLEKLWYRRQVLVESLGADRQNREAAARAQRALDDAANGLERLLGVRNGEQARAILVRWEAWTNERGLLAHQVGEAEAAVGEQVARLDQTAGHAGRALAAVGVSAAAPEEARARLEALGEEQWRRQAELQAVELELAQLSTQRQERMGRLEDPALLAEQLAEAEARCAAIRRRLTAVEAARDLIQKVAEEHRRDFAPRLSVGVGAHLARVTNERYTRVEIAPENLAVRLKSTERGGLVTLNQVSTGTRDAVALLLRVGIVDLLSKPGEPVPLFLDDPLVNLDPERSRAALQVLQDLAAERQVFYFTQDPRLAEWAAEVGPCEVIRLPR